MSGRVLYQIEVAGLRMCLYGPEERGLIGGLHILPACLDAPHMQGESFDWSPLTVWGNTKSEYYLSKNFSLKSRFQPQPNPKKQIQLIVTARMFKTIPSRRKEDLV